MRFYGCLLLAFCACRVGTNPNEGRFSCKESLDCGAAFSCRPQVDGGGLCFPSADCQGSETCDGSDENCDGVVDETFPEMGASCLAAALGVCERGVRVCVEGALQCRPVLQPSTEACNGLDDDCNGSVDETFDLMTDSANCSVCDRRCPTRTACVSGTCRESVCFDGLDNDENGLTDCADESCLAQTCSVGISPSWSCGLRIMPDAGQRDADSGIDADAGFTDAGVIDAGVDAGVELDAGLPDAGPPDSGFPDAGAADSGFEDSGTDGGGLADAGSEDAGFFADAGDSGTDAGEADSGLQDAGLALDGGLADAGTVPVDAGVFGRACFPPEDNCRNGSDDDGDGKADCADLDCAAQSCAVGFTCQGGVCTP